MIVKVRATHRIVRVFAIDMQCLLVACTAALGPRRFQPGAAALMALRFDPKSVLDRVLDTASIKRHASRYAARPNLHWFLRVTFKATKLGVQWSLRREGRFIVSGQ